VRMLNLLVAFCLMMAAAGSAQLSGSLPADRERAKTVEQSPRGGVVVEPPGQWGDVRVNLSLDRSQIQVNDLVSMSVRTNRDAYLFVYTTDEKGVTRQLAPNFYDSDNFVRAGESFRVPSGKYQLRASSTGWQVITVHAVSTDGQYWRPNTTRMKLSSQEPFPVMPRDPRGMREDLRSSVEQSWKDAARTRRSTQVSGGASTSGSVDGQGIVVEQPGQRPTDPCWGEASARLFVRGTVGGPSTGGGGGPVNPDPDRPRPGNRRAEVTLTSSPNDAEVYFDEYFYGRTPLTVAVPPGYYRIRVKKDGYKTWERRLNLRDGDEKTFSVRLPR